MFFDIFSKRYRKMNAKSRGEGRAKDLLDGNILTIVNI